MKALSFLLAALAAPAVLCCSASAADTAPEAIKGMLPCNGTVVQGSVVRIERDAEFVKLHQAALEAFAKLPQDKQKAIAEASDPSKVMSYNADLWPNKADYDKYVAAWKKSRLVRAMDVALGLQENADKTYSVLSATKVAENAVQPITLGALRYNPAKNVWISNNGELTAKPFSAGEDFDFGAQTGTEWRMEKEDALSKMAEMVRITKTTDGKFVFVAYSLVEVSAISGAPISQHGYIIAFPQTAASANTAKPGQK